MANLAPPPKSTGWLTWLMHVFLVILGLGAVTLIEHSPHPALGVVVLALVLGVELRTFWPK